MNIVKAKPARDNTVGVLFVCLGNICRSPSAEGIFGHIAEQAGLAHLIQVDSAGTAAYHVGSAPDLRSQNAAKRRGVNIANQKARKVTVGDFKRFDYVLAMDRDNYANLLRICPPEQKHRLRLFLSFAPHLDCEDVPDPYYGGPNGFEIVLDLIEAASCGLLEHIQTNNFQ